MQQSKQCFVLHILEFFCFLPPKSVPSLPAQLPVPLTAVFSGEEDRGEQGQGSSKFHQVARGGGWHQMPAFPVWAVIEKSRMRNTMFCKKDTSGHEELQPRRKNQGVQQGWGERMH